MNEKKLRLILISAVNRQVQKSYYPELQVNPLGLQIIAALTPNHWDVKIFDESLDEFTDFIDCDLVGISASTVNATHAYEIASKYRERGIKTIMGGVHASPMLEEALNYVDCVVIGEAELIWKILIEDFENGELKSIYGPSYCTGEQMVILDHSDLDDRYFAVGIESSRGCPFACEYCYSTRHFGNRYKHRPIEDVIKELRTIKKKVVYFTDDNFFGFTERHFEQKKKLLQMIIDNKLNKIWGTQSSINIADRVDLLKLAYKAGLRQLYIGFESFNLKVLKEMNKQANISFLKLKDVQDDFLAMLEKYKIAIKTIQKCGIGVVGATMYGMDDDDLDSLLRISEFFKRSKVDALDIGIVVPLPGTPLYERVKEEGRLMYSNFPADWDELLMDRLIIKPKHISIDEFYKNYYLHLNRILKIFRWRRGFWATLFHTKNIVVALGFRTLCKGYKQHVLNHRKTIKKMMKKYDTSLWN
ncbi:MAG: B12-binding domain-containing radical SAM protein [Candidatus Lokiarchaeota archaeon]|nr:B12-binding domain-containing radical SAM protein [Candidatus Lokiarchaeota archaeon]